MSYKILAKIKESAPDGAEYFTPINLNFYKIVDDDVFTYFDNEWIRSGSLDFLFMSSIVTGNIILLIQRTGLDSESVYLSQFGKDDYLKSFGLGD